MSCQPVNSVCTLTFRPGKNFHSSGSYSKPRNETRQDSKRSTSNLQGVSRRHGQRLDAVRVGGEQLQGGPPAVGAEVEVEDGRLVQPVVVAVEEAGLDEVLAAGRNRPERVAAPRGGAAGEVPKGSVPVVQVRPDVRRFDAGGEPRVGEAGVGDVDEAARGLVGVGPALRDAAVDADETWRARNIINCKSLII